MPSTTELDATLHGHMHTHAKQLVTSLRKKVLQGLQPTPGFFFWPKTPLVNAKGQQLDGVVAMDVKTDEELLRHIPAVVRKYGAQGVFVIRVREQGIQFILESPAQMESWRLEWVRHGDVRTLSEPIHETHDTTWLAVSWG